MSPRRAHARPVAILLLVVLALVAPGAAPGQSATDGADLPKPAGYVNDLARVFDEPSRAKLEGFLDQVQRKTGVQYAVLVVDSVAGETPAEYKVRVFQAWGIGDRARDDGLLMLVALREHRVEFETGYGLEGTLTDAFESRVVREVMAPRMRAGDLPGGITEGVLATAARIAKEKGVTLEWDGRQLRYRGRSQPPFNLVVAIFLFVFILIVLNAIKNFDSGGWGGMNGPPISRRFRGYGGGGGYGGGWGGGFGGGGGGGGSFGGFGGGSSGGGGGGGSW